MFTDIVGFTALNQSNEEQALEVLGRHNRLLRPFFPKFRGREIKTMGDSFLVEFDSALNATKCAIQIQKFLHDYNISTNESWKIKVRIGIHIGDVVRKRKDIFGDAVNIASRIQPLADPEGICISQQVFDQVHNKIEYPIRQLEHPELRNINFQTNVYSVEMPWQTRGFAASQQELHEQNGMRIAVLPFSNMSPDPNDEYFADGITEEIISTISKIHGLEVISRTSIMQYKSTPKPIREVSKELVVGTILEGSVRKAGNKLRISIQMIDAARDRHLWAENYDRELQDVFVIQSDVANKVADALQATISKSDYEVEPTESLGAYTMYLRAMQLFHEGTESGLKKAISLFEKSINQDKTFARAYTGLAQAWNRMSNSGFEDFVIATRRATIAARKAVQLAPDLADAHAALATTYLYLDKYDDSILEAEKAIQLNPNISEAHICLGSNRASVNLEESLAEFQKAYELDPLSYEAIEHLALVYTTLNKTSEALAVLEKFRHLNPRYAKIYVQLANCYMEMKEFSQAQRMLDFCFKLDPNDVEGWIDQGLLCALTGKKDEARAILEDLMKNEKESVRLWAQFWIQNAFGNLDAVFKALMRMGETHDWPFLIKYLSDFKELRKDLRFVEFCKSVGLTP